jgi:peptide-methionine (S)-S-oxide reductase
MTPSEFIKKWKAANLKERSAAQEHFIDLCRLMGEQTPAEADPEGEWYCFERGASKLAGGDVPNATYRNHGTHAKGIEILFDPDRISYRRLLEYFFQIHDPTTLNRQGNDWGASYRSAIYYVNQAQKQTALETIADVNASGLWPGKVVTPVEPVGDFWEAEPEHQDYLERYPDGYTCHYPRPDWVLSRRAPE